MKAKDIIIRVIDKKTSDKFVKENHYSGKVASTSELHFGIFYKSILYGVMQYGRSINKSKLIGLIEGTGWNEFIELNRMVVKDGTPKNTESRALAVSFKLIKKNAPHIKWIVSFSDGCQCGDGTIYRASGFELTGIKQNKALIKLPNGEVVHTLSFGGGHRSKRREEMLKKGYSNSKKYLDDYYEGWEYISGFMLRYIIHLKPNLKRNYEILPYSKIEEMGAKMYKGIKKEV